MATSATGQKPRPVAGGPGQCTRYTVERSMLEHMDEDDKLALLLKQSGTAAGL